MTIDERLMTVDALREIADLPENENKRFELIKGVLYEVPRATPEHAYLSNQFGRFFDEHCEAYDLGYGFGDSCSYIMSEMDELIPLMRPSFQKKSRVRRSLKNFTLHRILP